MIFSSLTFLFAFLPIVLLLYYVVPRPAKNVILLAASLLFYAWGEPIYVLLMIFSILFNYAFGLLMERYQEHKKYILVYTVIINLLILGFFKYYGFLLGTVNDVFHTSIPVRKLALPIGISFYTFQAMSYVIDLYRGRYKAQKNVIAFATYITMFPQLIAGPIVRYQDIEKQLVRRKINFSHFGRGSVRFIFGLSKKVLLANSVGAIFDTIHASGGNVSAASAWIAAIAYTFQIYFDFSGYSDMAIGLGEMLGFQFLENFDRPYIADSVTDFWRRWHISLSGWFKEYVYIPLGGNRVSTAKHIRNIMIVWLLTGLWHGANWTFVCWGLYYGILLLFDKYVWQKYVKLPSFFNHVLTMLLVIFGWVIFSADNLGQIGSLFLAMIGCSGFGLINDSAIYMLESNWIMLLICLVVSIIPGMRLYRIVRRRPAGQVFLALYLLVLLLLCMICLATQNYNPFLYFQF